MRPRAAPRSARMPGSRCMRPRREERRAAPVALPRGRSSRPGRRARRGLFPRRPPRPGSAPGDTPGSAPGRRCRPRRRRPPFRRASGPPPRHGTGARRSKRARRLHDQARLLGRQAHAGRDLGLRDGHDAVEVGAQVGERSGPSACVRVPSAMVRETSAADHRRSRPAPATRGRRRRARAPRRSRGPTDRSAFTATATPLASPPPPIGHEHGGRSAMSSAISRPQVPWPAMMRSSSNGGMIARPRSAAMRSATACRSALAGPTVTTSAPSVEDPGALDRRGVVRHDHDGRAAQQAGGAGDALGVVARRVGDDATPQLGRPERGDRRIRAAQLERPDRLERLRLEQLSARRIAERDERCPGGDPAQQDRGGADSVEADQGRRVRSRACSRADGPPPETTAQWAWLPHATQVVAQGPAPGAQPGSRRRTSRRSGTYPRQGARGHG